MMDDIDLEFAGKMDDFIDANINAIAGKADMEMPVVTGWSVVIETTDQAKGKYDENRIWCYKQHKPGISSMHADGLMHEAIHGDWGGDS